MHNEYITYKFPALDTAHNISKPDSFHFCSQYPKVLKLNYLSFATIMIFCIKRHLYPLSISVIHVNLGPIVSLYLFSLLGKMGRFPAHKCACSYI